MANYFATLAFFLGGVLYSSPPAVSAAGSLSGALAGANCNRLNTQEINIVAKSKLGSSQVARF